MPTPDTQQIRTDKINSLLPHISMERLQMSILREALKHMPAQTLCKVHREVERELAGIKAPVDYPIMDGEDVMTP